MSASTIGTIILLLLSSILVDARPNEPRRRSAFPHRAVLDQREAAGTQAIDLQTPQRRAVSGWSLVGCVKDGSSRALTGYSYNDYSLTQDKCINTCQSKGFTYAAMEIGYQCYCGNKLENGLGQTISSSSCSSACYGDSSAKCGGAYSLTLFKRTSPVASSSRSSSSIRTSSSSRAVSSTRPTSSSIRSSSSSKAVTTSIRASSSSSPTRTSSVLSRRTTAATSTSVAASSLATMGCYSDSSSDRALTGPSISSDSNSVSQCASWCANQGYSVSGVKYSSWCFCGTAPAASKKVAASSCNMKCSGSSETCGAVSAMNIYSLSTATGSSVSSTVAPSASVSAPVGWNALGCYKEGSGFRILNGSYKSDSKLTPDTCATYCLSQGYGYMGLEFGYQCFCGSAVSSDYKVADSQCTTACPGDSKSICGGTSRLNIYRYTASVPSVTSLIVSTSTIATAPTTTGCNAACASVLGVPSIPSSGRKNLWAHHMVGNTYSYTQETWRDDISQASAAGFDGFALNHGSSDWQFDRMDDAYAAAASLGNFKLFLSIDVTAIGCTTVSDARRISDIILQYANSTAQVMYNNRTLVSTFAGDGCYFGTGSAQGGWNLVRNLTRTGGKEIYLIPAIFVDPSSFKSMTWFDGLLNWDSAWPIGSAGGQALTTASDNTWMGNLGGRTYMPSISPLFFTYYGPNSWNKDWIYRGDDWLIARRFEQLISMRNQIDMAEFITWNDYGESHYVGPIRADQPNSQGWVDGFPHTAWHPLIKYYAQAFKTGSYPSITVDQMWLWTRPHPKAANPTAPTNPRPTNWQNTDDNLYAFLLLSSPATVTISSGNNTGVWVLQQGVNKISLASAPGIISGTIWRGGKMVKTVSSKDQFVYTNTPTDYNYNYWVTAV